MLQSVLNIPSQLFYNYMLSLLYGGGRGAEIGPILISSFSYITIAPFPTLNRVNKKVISEPNNFLFVQQQ